ncbi:hypothetical protein CPL00134L_CDS0073 [Escherichia phage Phagiculus]
MWVIFSCLLYIHRLHQVMAVLQVGESVNWIVLRWYTK